MINQTVTQTVSRPLRGIHVRTHSSGNLRGRVVSALCNFDSKKNILFMKIFAIIANSSMFFLGWALRENSKNPTIEKLGFSLVLASALISLIFPITVIIYEHSLHEHPVTREDLEIANNSVLENV